MLTKKSFKIDAEKANKLKLQPGNDKLVAKTTINGEIQMAHIYFYNNFVIPDKAQKHLGLINTAD